MLDNRAITITTKGTFKASKVKLIFSSVFRLQYFVKLLNVEWAELVQRFTRRNLKISTITWNMGQKKENTNMFEDNPNHFFKDIEINDSDILSITAQEVVNHNHALAAIEKFLHCNGFVNVDSRFISQWQMFLMVFVKKSLKPLITHVSRQAIPQGKLKGTIANKGGMACSFCLNGRFFNFIGGHLIHDPKPKRYLKRLEQFS